MCRYHHQRVGRLSSRLTAVARATDRTVEAAELASSNGWFLGMQWHPEDTAALDSAIFDQFTAAARRA
jgi:putative glutamine amidotransferase